MRGIEYPDGHEHLPIKDLEFNLQEAEDGIYHLALCSFTVPPEEIGECIVNKEALKKCKIANFDQGEE